MGVCAKVAPMDDTPSLGAATGATAELGEELAVRDWVHKQLALEIERLRSQETRIVPVPTLNLSVVRVRRYLPRPRPCPVALCA